MSSRFLVVPSLWLVFFVNGAVLSSWAPRIPEVKDRLALSDSEFGLALLGIALGSVPAMLLITHLLRHASGIAVCSGAVLLFPAALPLIDLTTNLAGLTAVLMLLGAASGALDVAMNALAVRLGGGAAADRFRCRTYQPDLHCCRSRHHCCGSAGQRSKGA